MEGPGPKKVCKPLSQRNTRPFFFVWKNTRHKLSFCCHSNRNPETPSPSQSWVTSRGRVLRLSSLGITDPAGASCRTPRLVSMCQSNCRAPERAKWSAGALISLLHRFLKKHPVQEHGAGGGGCTVDMNEVMAHFDLGLLFLASSLKEHSTPLSFSSSTCFVSVRASLRHQGFGFRRAERPFLFFSEANCE